MRNVTSYILRSNGEEFAQALKVKGIMVLHEVNKISRAKILLIDGSASEQQFSLSNLDFFKPGNDFEIDVGFDGETHNIFKGIITRHGIKVTKDNSSTLEIECKHAAAKLAQVHTNGLFRDQNNSEVISSLLDAAGIEYEIGEWPENQQAQLMHCESTDWEFILARSEANGALIFTEGSKLWLGVPQMDQDTALTCRYGSNIIEFEAVIDNEYQSPEIISQAWSPDDQQILEATGTASFENGLGNLDSSSLAEPWSGLITRMQHPGSLTNEELQAWSDAKATQNELAKVVGRVRVKGTHAIFPGNTIALEGFGDRFNGKGLITGVRHELQKGNWTTDIQIGKFPCGFIPYIPKAKSLNSPGLVPGSRGCLTGVVIQLADDPESSYRVKVKIPLWHEEGDGIWARLVQPYAGDEYGFCFYPELDDEVIITFLNDDPRHALVLGSVHSSARPAPHNTDDDNHIKVLHTRSGLKISFDDDEKKMELTTPSGNQILLDESAKTIAITDEHSNSISLNSDGIQ